MSPHNWRRTTWTSLFLFVWFVIRVHAASTVLGIDLGTEYHKAVLVKPGIPLDIVLTKDSKRKEAAALAFKPVSTTSDSSKNVFPERLYGGDALALAARFPGDVYINLKPLLGLTNPQSPAIEQFSRRYPGIQIAACKSGKICLKSATFAGSEEGFSVIELLAMQLQNIRGNAENMAGTTVRDVVITVPAFFTAEEKRAVETAADLAGLKVLSLTTDGLAVGLNYATSRTFPTVTEGAKPEYHLVYDMGAGSTTATIMKFQSRSVKDVGKFNKTIQEILVAGTGWDRTLGGDALNSAVLDDMVAKFAATAPIKKLGVSVNDIVSHGRTIAKMWKEAERMRQVLSANTETQATFESLYHEDVNFKYKISRAEFEKMAAEFEERVKSPIVQALEMAKLEIDDLTSIIPYGGAVRTPFVQRALEAVAGKADRLRTNVNSDEAAAFGAAFRGATLSSSFRVKEIWTNETATFPVNLSWKMNKKDKTQKLFIPTSHAGFEKQIPLRIAEETSFVFTQEIPEAIAKESISVSRTTTTNLTASVSELVEKHGCASDNITAAFDVRLSAVNTLPEIARAYVSCEALDTKKGVVDGVKGLFGFGSKKEGQEVVLDDEVILDPEATIESSSTTSVSSETASSKSSEKSKAAEKPKKPTKLRFVVNVALTTEPISTAQISGSELTAVKSRMKAFDASDKDRKAREEASNKLEGYTYQIRDFLGDEGFVDASIDEVRAQIKSLSEAASEWLYGDGLSATTAELKAKYKEMADLITPISARKDENKRRPDSIFNLQGALEQTKNIITSLKNQSQKAAEAAAEAAKSIAEQVTETASTTGGLNELDELDDDPVATPSEVPTDSQPAIISDEELEKITSAYTAVEQWLVEKVEAQSKLLGSDEPVLTVREIELKAAELQMVLIEALSKQMAGKQTKPSKSSKSSSSAKSTKSSTSKTKTSSSKKSKSTDKADVKEEL